MSLRFSKDEILQIHSKLVSNEEMIEEFLSLPAGKVDYPSFLSWVKSKI